MKQQNTVCRCHFLYLLCHSLSVYHVSSFLSSSCFVVSSSLLRHVLSQHSSTLSGTIETSPLLLEQYCSLSFIIRSFIAIHSYAHKHHLFPSILHSEFSVGGKVPAKSKDSGVIPLVASISAVICFLALLPVVHRLDERRARKLNTKSMPCSERTSGSGGWDIGCLAQTQHHLSCYPIAIWRHLLSQSDRVLQTVTLTTAACCTDMSALSCNAADIL